MHAMARRAANAYSMVSTETGLAGADPHKLILMLFEGARLAVSKAKLHLKQGETAAKGEAISKAIAIIDQGLKASLNVEAGGDLAEKLRALYEYMSTRLLAANLKNDLGALEEVGQLLAELHEAWKAIGQPQSKSPTGSAAASQLRSAQQIEKALP